MDVDPASYVFVLLANASTGSEEGFQLQDSALDAYKTIGIFVVVLVVSLSVLCLAASSSICPDSVTDVSRFLTFVILHLADYVTNILTMIIMYMTGHSKYLYILLPVHITIGGFCLFTTITCLEWRAWCGPGWLKFLFMGIVMGLMQGVQVQLAYDDYVQQVTIRRTGTLSDELQVPGMTPTRFYCKAIDGILEGTVFAFVAMYALLKFWMFETGNDNLHNYDIEEWQQKSLYLGGVLSFLTTGLALMEVDHRTSAAVQRVLGRAPLRQMQHLFFRASEVALRLFSVVLFLVYVRLFQETWWIAFVVAVADYFVGTTLLVVLGGKDPLQYATVLLGVPLFMANVMQFVDAPGMSLQARRISSIIVPFRLLELVAIVVFCWWDPQKVDDMEIFEYLINYQPEWFATWVLVGIMYLFLLLTYARQITPEADLHSAVAYGELDTLKELLCGSELVLDINRYGPDGRTPLHLAALRGQVDCIYLLIDQKANIMHRTNDRFRNTALHLAAMNARPEALESLCQRCSGDTNFLDAQNVHGDTALHIASRRHNLDGVRLLLQVQQINSKVRNGKGLTAADCAPSENFIFDRSSPESAIADLFRSRADGTLGGPTASSTGGSVEMAEMALGEERLGSSGAARLMAGLDPEAPSPSAQEEENHHNVNLIGISMAQEEAFLKKAGAGEVASNASGSKRNLVSSTPVTSSGISSFMMSAGLGTMSRAFLTAIKEDEETSTAAPGGDKPSASFEDFQEIEKLGEGAFGKVLLVKHATSGELFAMKLMDKAKFKAQKITTKAHSEQYILKTTRHQFIVALHYAFQGSTLWALVMDYCPHGDLQDALVAHGTPGLALKDAARLSGECLLALAHLHGMQVIFRDLKLENVVIDQQWRARLTDFGLAKKLYTTEEARTMCGSYGYAAPEIMLNTGRYSYSVDLYSFGVMLYMMLSGGETQSSRPKQRLPPMRHPSLRRKLRDAEKEPPGEWAKERVGGMALLMKLTSTEPSDRGTCASVMESAFFRQLLPKGVSALANAEPLEINKIGKTPPSKS